MKSTEATAVRSEERAASRTKPVPSGGGAEGSAATTSERASGVRTFLRGEEEALLLDDDDDDDDAPGTSFSSSCVCFFCFGKRGRRKRGEKNF